MLCNLQLKDPKRNIAGRPSLSRNEDEYESSRKIMDKTYLMTSDIIFD